jgi:Mg/Co/Ni transporter MgtE
VTNQDKELLGIISLSDILLKAGEKKSVRKLIFSTLNAIAKPAPIVLKEQDETAED